MNRKSAVLYILAVLTITGCNHYREISIENFAIRQFNMTSLSTARMKISATLNNPTGGRVQLTGMEGVLKLKDKPVAQFYLDSAMVFTPREVSTSEGVLSLKISDLSVLLSGTVDLDETLLDHVVLDIDATFRSGGIRKKMHFNNIAAKKFLNL
ncbi:MAG: hypothetical protein WC377_04655 [Bacteroidales bacterium]|jgi:hypothetical protein|nr:hypothetical protein [Bacteroidales bacterium]MDD2823565.1 hypothetical protein [Bacteroidales bacterium]MDD3100658.1 hypothetical protein [Bacteroidales bacterium]MDD3639597.1 hypothetical protein [Bacteroidales bacterium]MDD3944273.1 hypothetical protein [Bacteroidales bacterium]